MTTAFVYDTVTDFSNGVDVSPALVAELAASSIVPALDLTLTKIDGTTLTLVFDASLSAAEETTLHGDASPPAQGSMLGDHAGPPVTPPSVTGSRGDGTALANLLVALDGAGVITDDTSA